MPPHRSISALVSSAKVIPIRSRTAPVSRRFVGEPPVEGDRRSTGRVFTADPGMMRILEPFSAAAWAVRVLDISKTGMGLLTPVPLTPGNLIYVQVKETAFLASVRHCARTSDAELDRPFQVGVEIQHVF